MSTWPLEMRRKLGRKEWNVPTPFGPDGWMLDRLDGAARIIATRFDWDGIEWVHASTVTEGRMPTYDDLVLMHQAVFGDGYAYQAFVPRDRHINIHGGALHLWGRLDGAAVLPEFGKFGSI